jgi:hypothetical protein
MGRLRPRAAQPSIRRRDNPPNTRLVRLSTVTPCNRAGVRNSSQPGAGADLAARARTRSRATRYRLPWGTSLAHVDFSAGRFDRRQTGRSSANQLAPSEDGPARSWLRLGPQRQRAFRGAGWLLAHLHEGSCRSPERRSAPAPSKSPKNQRTGTGARAPDRTGAADCGSLLPVTRRGDQSRARAPERTEPLRRNSHALALARRRRFRHRARVQEALARACDAPGRGATEARIHAGSADEKPGCGGCSNSLEMLVSDWVHRVCTELLVTVTIRCPVRILRRSARPIPG